MQTSRFQLGLIATLAVGLGFSLSSSEAVGYPAGAAVSLGTNPIVARAGIVYAETVEILSTDDDQAFIVTDLLLTASDHSCNSYVTLDTSAGITIAGAKLHSRFASTSSSSGGVSLVQTQPSSIQHSFKSGLPLGHGETLSITSTGGCTVAYTLSGYYAQP